MEDGLPTPRRYWAALSIWLAISMVVLDTSIANVALPTIAQDLGASPENAIWVVNAYQIATVMLLLPIAAAAEIVGYRRVYMIGLSLFVLASLGCTLAGDLTTLAATRFLQGFGAAAIMAINGALVRFTYPKAQLGRGVGFNALIVAIASTAGPSVASAILAIGSWRWLFAVNVPVGLLAIAIGSRALPDLAGNRRPFSIVAALLNAALFAAAFLAISAASQGRFEWLTWIEAAVAVGTGTLLYRAVRDQEAPLIPLDLLRIPILRLSYATSICSFAAQMVGLVSLPFYLQFRYGFDHVRAGLLITPWPVAIGLTSPLAGWLVERVPAGRLGALGMLIMATGFCLIAAAPVEHGIVIVEIGLFACGGGLGFFQSPNNRVMIGTAPHHRSGAAAGMLATARLIGQTGGAVLVALTFHLAGTASRSPYMIGALLAATAAVTSARRIGADHGHDDKFQKRSQRL